MNAAEIDALMVALLTIAVRRDREGWHDSMADDLNAVITRLNLGDVAALLGKVVLVGGAALNGMEDAYKLLDAAGGASVDGPTTATAWLQALALMGDGPPAP